MPSTIYVDYLSGNDANNGLTFATRKKTLSGASLTSVASAGDEIRVMQSDNPINLDNGAWTNLGTFVTLTANPVQHLYYDGAWTAGSGVTASTSTTRKQGANSSVFTVAAGWAADTNLGYYPLTAVRDLSPYSAISFWLYFVTASINIDALRVNLCSDGLGAVPVNTLYVSAGKPPGTVAANTWIPITIRGTFGTNISSIAITSSVDPGAFTFHIDNVFATNNINLQGIIGKNTEADPTWWAIRAVENTKILIEGQPNSSAGTASRGYVGTTETAPVYYRDPIPLGMQIVALNNIFTFMANGSANNYINISGGWNKTDMTTQPAGAVTFFSPLNAYGNVFFLSNTNYLKFSRFITSRANCSYYTSNNNCNFLEIYNDGGTSHTGAAYSLNMAATHGRRLKFVKCWANTSGAGTTFTRGVGWEVNNMLLYSNVADGWNSNVNWASTFSAVDFSNNASDGLDATAMRDCALYNVKFTRNTSRGLAFTTCSNNTFYDPVIALNSNVAFAPINSYNTLMYNLSTYSNTVGCFTLGAGPSEIYLYNFRRGEATIVNTYTDYEHARIISINEQGVPDSHFIYTDNGLITTDSTIIHGTTGISWKLSPTSTIRDDLYPLTQRIGHVLCQANLPLSASVWMYRNNTNITGRFKCPVDQLSGVNVNQSVLMTAASGVWEKLTLAITPTQTGFVEFYVDAYGGTTSSVYWDDFSCTSTVLDASSGDYAFLREGVIVTPAVLGSASAPVENTQMNWTFS